MEVRQLEDLRWRCDVARAKYNRQRKKSVLVDALVLHELIQVYDRHQDCPPTNKDKL